MRSLWAVVAGLFLAAATGTTFAHLCNDVFAQARDNLVVKVDIRDGQLRIGKEATFHVYLLNTMDRAISDIRLEVVSEHFVARVRPDPTWRSFPALKAVRQGGRKQYFTVTLRRKPGVPDGRYRIRLRLYNGRDRSKSFKTVDLAQAADVKVLARAGGIVVDGHGSRAEWQDAVMCDGLYAYLKRGKYFANVPAREQVRVRFAADEDYLYCLMNFQGGGDAESDAIALYTAPTTDAEPVVLRFDRLTGKVEGPRGVEQVEFRLSPDRSTAECRIPLSLLGLRGATSFYANVTREIRRGKAPLVTYWRGNEFTRLDPVAYARFVVAD